MSPRRRWRKRPRSSATATGARAGARVVILGVDPGSVRTGWGVIETGGRGHRLLEQGVLTPGTRLDLPRKLEHIHAGVAALIARLRPDQLAVEDCFHHVNTRTALVLGHVR